MGKRIWVEPEVCSYTKSFCITTSQELSEYIGNGRENLKIVSERMVAPNAI